ncbi:MAG: NifB/NifX family molybdenum-iron cluster-binding protein [Phycisphaerae bacterium]
MKVAVTAQGPELDSQVDPRFGRAKCFVIVDTETSQVNAVDNTVNLNAVQGAGIQAAQKVASMGVSAVVTGHVGPKAFVALQAGSVSVFTGASGSVRQAVDQLKAGLLKQADKATVEGHWV